MLSAHPLCDGVVVTDPVLLRLLDADHEPVLPTQESVVNAVSTVAEAVIPFVADASDKLDVPARKRLRTKTPADATFWKTEMVDDPTTCDAIASSWTQPEHKCDMTGCPTILEWGTWPHKKLYTFVNEKV